MKCPKCDASITADSRFCKFCGAATAAAVRPTEKPASAAAPDGKPSDVHRDPDQEQAVWRGRPAWRSFLGAWLGWLVLGLAGVIAAYRYAGGESALFAVVVIFVGGAGVALWVREALIVYGLSYQITTQRLFVHRGILARTTDQLELLRVDDVRLCQGVIDRVVGTGSLDIFGTDATDEHLTLRSIPAPMDVAEAIRRNVRSVRSKGTLAVERV